MKSYIKNFKSGVSWVVYITLFICVVSPTLLLATPLNPAEPAPLDGGLVALLAAGAAYGAKKLKTSRK
jgi:hypothetical protein